MNKVEIRSLSTETGDGPKEKTIVIVDGEIIGSGRYGGEPEDNFRFRQYDWVEALIANVCKKLGAEVTVTEGEYE